jgi:hypothetical protein
MLKRRTWKCSLNLVQHRYFSNDKGDAGSSLASMTLRHIINNDVTTFLNKDLQKPGSSSQRVLQTKPDPVFVLPLLLLLLLLLLPATLENWKK